jgi:hypothetical protein
MVAPSCCTHEFALVHECIVILKECIFPAGSITPTGVFATGTQTTPLYTAASSGNATTLNLGLASGTVAGESQTREIMTVVFNLANGVAPLASSFALSDLAVVDAAYITGSSGSVTAVTLQ